MFACLRAHDTNLAWTNSDICVQSYVRVCVFACLRVCVFACLRVCACYIILVAMSSFRLGRAYFLDEHIDRL